MPLNKKQIAILQAIANGQTSQDQIASTLNFDKNLVAHYLDEMNKSGFIQASKGSDGSIGLPKYLLCQLTQKGRVALNNLDDLIQNESSSAIINQSGTFGVGVNQGEIKSQKLAGTINEAQSQSLAEAAAEIQQLLKVLDRSYPADLPADTQAEIDVAVKGIAKDPALKQRVVAALKEGGIKALETFTESPYVSILVAAYKGWQKG